MAAKNVSGIEAEVRQKCLSALKRNEDSLPFKLEESCGSDDLQEMAEENDWNYVFRVRNTDETASMKLIHAEPYVRVMGPEMDLDIDRLERERMAMGRFQELLPGCVSKIHFNDTTSNTLGVEDEDDMHIFKVALLNGLFDKQRAEAIGAAVARIHEQTHVTRIGQERLAELDEEFRNEEKLGMCEDYFFDRTFTRGLPNNQSEEVEKRLEMIGADDIVQDAVQTMKRKFREQKDCLINADLHGGAMWTDGERVIFTSAQLARIGPAAYDIGQLVASYIIAYYRHISAPTFYINQHHTFSYTIIDTCKATVVKYFNEAAQMSDASDELKKEFMTDVAGFAGCEIVRRIVGALHDKELDGIKYAEEDAIGAGVRLLQGHKRIHSIDFLMNVALMLTW